MNGLNNTKMSREEYMSYLSDLLDKHEDIIEELGWKKVRYCRNLKNMNGVKYHFRCSECGWNILNNGNIVYQFMAEGITHCPLCDCEIIS